MKAALYDERDGYYCRRDRVRQGRQGDYRTAPEMSPLFGAAFANYFMKSYFDLGAPPAWTIVEIGSGTGDFAHDVLRSLQTNFPDVFRDRKSTRLNSSHSQISYAVFCLKQKRTAPRTE